MHWILLVGRVIRHGGALSTIPQFSAIQSQCKCSLASLAHQQGKKHGNKQRQPTTRSRSTTRRRRQGNRDRMESMQDWVEQDSFSTKESSKHSSSVTQETPLIVLLQQNPHATQRKNGNSDLPLEIWAESTSSDSTFFHGQKGLALEWTAPSVQTSQHASVKAVLKEIQSKAPNVHVQSTRAPLARHKKIVEDLVDWSDETNDTEEDEESDWH